MSSEVPHGWLETNLGAVATLGGGTTPSKSEAGYWEDANVPWATPSDITSIPNGESQIDSTETAVSERALRECSLTLNPPGTILMTSRATIGYAAINAVPMVTNQGFITFRCNEKSDPHFLYQWLIANRRNLIAAAGGSTFKELGRGTAKLLPILLPPIDEQRRIAEVLRSLDEAVVASEAVQSTLGKILRRRREQLIEEARGASPEVAVADALRKNRGNKIKKLQTDQYADVGRYPIVDQGARFICGFTDDDEAVWPYDLPVIVFGDHTRILKFVEFPFAIGADGTQCLTPAEGISPRYFYYALQSLDIQAEGYARHFKLLKERTIPIPAPAQQTRIEAELAAIETVLSEARQSSLALRAVGVAMASDLLCGRVRVPA